MSKQGCQATGIRGKLTDTHTQIRHPSEAEDTSLELQIFEYTDYISFDMEHDIDPDKNFFTCANKNCGYYTDEAHNQINKDGRLSVIHINSRSLYTNFENVKNYLHGLAQPFSIIAISETWMHKKNGSGGGVALFVDINLRFSVVEDMSLTVENIFECLTIEFHREHRKNVILSCIYRKPGSCVEQFCEYMEEMYTKNASKTIIVCGDFNIDMLNPNNHKLTENFINTIYSLNLYPKITRPTRITTHSATLIDNILTNEIFNDAISDISDHLPVFTVFGSDCKPHQEPLSKFKRLRSEESLNVFKNDLFVQNWDGVYDKSNVHDAYDEFMRIFKKLYDKKCPLKRICTISKKK